MKRAFGGNGDEAIFAVGAGYYTQCHQLNESLRSFPIGFP